MIKSKVKNVSSLERLIEIEVAQKLVDDKFDEVIIDIQKNATIAGFRKGKAPRDVVIEKHLAAAEEEVMRQLIPESYQKAIIEHKLDVIGLPDIDKVDLKRGKGLNYQAKIILMPEVKLKNYKGLKIKKKKIVATDEDVDKVLKFLQEQYAELSEVKDRGARMGDYCRCEFNKQSSWVAMDKNNPVKGLVAGIAGMKPSEKKSIPVKREDKDEVYELTLLDIKEKKIKELNDEFARNIPGGFKDLSGLKARIKEDFIARREAQAKLDLENQIFDQLLKGANFDVPKKMVTAEAEVITREMKERKEPADKAEELARRRIRLYFILNRIQQEEKISLSKEEFEDKIKALQETTGQDLSKHRDNLYSRLSREKVIEFLLKNASIKE